MKRKFLFITGSRGEWGYIRPILRLCKKRKDVEFSLCVTNMHLLSSFGLSKNEIESDGFKIDHLIYMALDGYNHYTMVKSLGIFLNSLADIISSARPDWIVLAGDRGEQLMGAVAGAYCYIPVAHIQAGDLSGNIDGMTRHAIGKYAHLHFASNKDAALRLLKLGEEPFRVHTVGAPQLDELVQGLFTSKDDLQKKYAVDLNREYLILVQHPVTEEYSMTAAQIKVTMEALKEFKMLKIAIFPNNDAGSNMVREGIEDGRQGDFLVFSNLKREDYIGFMKHASSMIGNSSSALIEAPVFRLPVVNLGRRQESRIRGDNVLNAPFEKSAIVQVLKKALSKKFRAGLRKSCFNPYGDGRAAEQIIKILLKTQIDDKLLIKKITY